MPRHRPGRCRRCLKRDDEVGMISWGGLCAPCGEAAVIENANALNLKRGPAYEHWRHGCDRAAIRRARAILKQRQAQQAAQQPQ